MAKLTFNRRWLQVVPDILGNRDAEQQFGLRVKRLTVGELEDFTAASWDMRGRLLDGVTVDELEELFGDVVQGPVGELVIDDEPVTDLRGLLHYVALDPPLAGCMFDELRNAVIVANHLDETQRKNCERRHGGDGGQAMTAASPHPSAAPDAASRSTEDGTSSASGETGSPEP